VLVHNSCVQAGEDLYVSSYSKASKANIEANINRTDKFNDHHAVQNAVSRVSKYKGITITLKETFHKRTRTYGKKIENETLHENLARDVMDIKILTEAGYDRKLINQQLKELIRQNKAIGGFEK